MDYTEIVDLALSYADREDNEVTSRMDKFLKIVEARVNRKLKTFDMSLHLTIPIADDTQVYYDLPSDYGGLRTIESADPGGKERTIEFMTPQQLTSVGNVEGRIDSCFVTVGRPPGKIIGLRVRR